MENEYSVVPARIKQERENMDLSQEYVSRKIGISQSYLSRVEAGVNYLHYDHMTRLKSIGMDTHFIFTGARTDLIEVQTLLDGMRPADYYYLAQMFYIILERLCTAQNDGRYSQLWRESQYMKYVLLNKPTKKNMCLLIREYCGITQAKMAVELGLERKSYQYIEKKISNINSSNVFVLYNKFHIPPMMVLNDDMGIWFGIVDIMKQLKPADKNEILRVLKKNL